MTLVLAMTPGAQFLDFDLCFLLLVGVLSAHRTSSPNRTPPGKRPSPSALTVAAAGRGAQGH